MLHDFLTDEQKAVVRKVMWRCEVFSKRPPFLPKSVGIVIRRPFVMVEIDWGSESNPPKTYGFSKQCTYQPAADVWDREIGVGIALSRAVRQYATAIEG